MSISTYSPQDVLVSLAGVHTVTGYADGTFINIHKEVKPFQKQRSMGGETARIYNKDEGFKVKLTLTQSSGSNNVLSMLYNIDLATRMGKFPLIIKDGSGQTSFIALTTWIEDIPEVTYSGKMETRTWTFGCSDAAIMIGGNEDTGAIESLLMVATASLPLLQQYLPTGSLSNLASTVSDKVSSLF
jgi:hypothetical protein